MLLFHQILFLNKISNKIYQTDNNSHNLFLKIFFFSKHSTFDYTLSLKDQSKRIADTVRNKLKALNLPRYKFMVQVVIGELRGQGVQMGSRCFWDSTSDSQVSETFVNDSLFCVATAYGVYYN